MTSSIERLVTNGETLKEVRHLYARSFADIASRLPRDFSPHHKGFVRTYFRMQLRIAQGQRIKAKKISSSLDKRTGYQEFENENQTLLAAIDIAVRGNTNWRDQLGKQVEPLFRLDDS